METFLEPQEKKKSNIVGYLVGGLVGILIIAGGIYIATRQPSMEDQMANVLDGSYREGTPEFAAITKDIIISTSDNTVESPNAFGKISMFITGTIRNKGTKVINGLEVNVGVVTQFNDVLKEKKVLVVPTQRPELGPGEIINITLSLDGFDKNDDRANIRWKVTAIRVAN
ncbi:MAG TPA: hypothetical protein VJV05_12430 [Pyrinomonadaceae bacterium]|nr:hypothetical protein [Pyrinomonadaceae bacterium]